MTQFDPFQLKKARKELKLSQKQFANALGKTQKTIWMWETGKNKPNVSALQEIAFYFASQFNSYRASKITGLDLENIQEVIKGKSTTLTNTPIKTHQEILIVEYESGERRWFSMNVETLITIVNDYSFIQDLQIIAEGNDL